MSLLLAAIMTFSVIQPFSSEIAAIDTTDTTITTDTNTSAINVNDLEYGEVFTDKSVSTGTLTIDQHNFSTEGFLVQLTSLAKEVKEKEEPVDIMIVLDTTMSTSNAAEGYQFSTGGMNGSIDDFVMAINIFIHNKGLARLG